METVFVWPRYKSQHKACSSRGVQKITVIIKSRLAQFAANTRLLEASERHLVVEGVVGVNPDGTGLERVRDLDGGVQVRGVHSSGQTVGGGVANTDRLLLGLELGDGADRAEDLFLHDLHVIGDVGEDGGLDEEALVALAVAAGLDCGTCILALLDVAVVRSVVAHHKFASRQHSLHDAVELDLGHLWALEGVLGEWVANNVLRRPLLELLDELVVDALLHVDAGTGTAALAMVEEDTEVDPRDGVVNVGVLKDDVWRLATKLKSDLLQVGASSGLHDLATDNSRASERDLVDVHVRGNGGTSDLTETRDDVDNTWWETGLLDQAGGDEATKRSLLSGLEDNSVAASDGRANLPRPHEQWEVPRDDLTAHTDWLLADVVEGVWGGVDDLALDLVCPAAVVPQAASAHADVHLRHGDGLAVVERLNRSEQVKVLLEQVGEVHKQLATVLWGLLPPWALECLAGCCYCNIDILLGGLVDGGDDALVGWVDDLKGLAVDTFHELVVDEAASR